MKKYALLLIAFTGTCLSNFVLADDFSVNPNLWEILPQDVKVVQLSSLTEDDLDEIREGKHPELAIEFAAQTHIPISFYLKGDLANLVENDEKLGRIEIRQTFYARCVDEKLILSSNLTDWKPFMEFITGNITASFSIQDGQPLIIVGSEINRRF